MAPGRFRRRMPAPGTRLPPILHGMTAPSITELPDPVRARAVALVATVLPEVVRLPPALKRVATFAPARRAKLGASAILAALEGPEEQADELRDRIAVQLAAALPYAAGEAPHEGDPAEAAALAWLMRPEGWTGLLSRALAQLAESASRAPDPGEMERLRGRLETTERELRETRADRKARLDELKAENAALRRRLGEARASAKDAGTGQEEARAAAESALAEARERLGAQDKALRQLRTQVERLEAELDAQRQAGRRSARLKKDESSLRARFLLDTLMDAAAGLRRELALPTVSGTPGERVEEELADVAEGEPGSRGSVVRSAAHLDQYLAMPRARLILDGYNISKTLWPSSSLEAQRIRLLQTLAPLVARTGAETTVVFDAASSANRPVVPAPRGIKVLFSPLGVIADDVIRDLVAAEPTGRVVLVVSDDQEVARDVARSGARSVPVNVFEGRLTPTT